MATHGGGHGRHPIHHDGGVLGAEPDHAAAAARARGRNGECGRSLGGHPQRRHLLCRHSLHRCGDCRRPPRPEADAGALSTGSYVSSLVGPLIGGALADLTGSYRIPFYCTSTTILLPPALVWFAVDEPLCGTAEGARQPVDPPQPDRGSGHAGPFGVAFRGTDGPIRRAHSAADRVPVYGLLQCRLPREPGLLCN